MIVVWGYGSIGKRHTQNLITLGANVCVISRSAAERSKSETGYPFYESLSALPTEEIDALIIATATAKHTEHLKVALDAGIKKIYLEKPVSHNWDDIDALTQLIEKSNAQVYVGYDLRFDEGLQQVKKLLTDGQIGKVCSFHAQVGQYLPDWRPQEDYREGMSAKKELGGGVMLDLVHELDYLYFLFGEATAVMNSNGHRSDLEINTEDTSDSLLLFKEGFSGTLHMDYLQKHLMRDLHIVGSQGTIHLDLAERNLRWNQTENPEWQSSDYSLVERNDRFLDALSAFLKGDPHHQLCSWEQALVSLNWVLRSKQSGLSGQVETLER